MKRMRVLFGQRRMQLLVTAAVLLLAAGVVVGSGANFSTTRAAAADNVFAAGFVDLTPIGAAFTIGPLAPGGEGSGTVTVENAGNVEGRFYLTGVDLDEFEGTDVNGVAAGEVLSTVLEIYVRDFNGNWSTNPVSLADLGDGTVEIDCGVLPANDGEAADTSDQGTVTVRAVFPDGDSGGTRGADNGLMNAISYLDLEWTVVSTGN